MLKPDPHLNFTPVHRGYPYQVDALEAVRSLEYSALFHEQGLGKTKIGIDLALTWLAANELDCIMIVTKRALVENWRQELDSHTNLAPRILTQDRSGNFNILNSPARLILAHFEVVRTEKERLRLFLATRRVGIVIDEAQKIKNPDAALTRAFHELRDGFRKRVIMTGTPVANRPEDIWSQIFFLDGGDALGEDFDAFRTGLTLDNDLYRSDTRQKELSEGLAAVFDRIRSFSVRETKLTAGIELPDKTVRTLAIQMEPLQGKLYAEYRDRAKAEIMRDDRQIVDDAEAVLKRLLRLVQVASNPMLVDDDYRILPGKFPELLRLVRDASDDGGKIIVWTSFVENAEWLGRSLADYGAVVVHGALDMDTRNAAVAAFKSDPDTEVLVATPGAAKEGLTLTVANQAVFYDRSFSLDDYLQAQDRIHRISQTRDCIIWNLVCENTVDEWVDRLLGAKRLAAQLMQSDISREEYDRSADYEFGRMVAEILSAAEVP